MPESRPGFVPSSFFAFRTALLPFEAYSGWGEGLAAPGAADLEAAWKADRAVLQARLRDWVTRPEIREALFLASPDLDEAIGHWLDKPDGEKGQRAERALVRYFSRMCGRSTPFGLFAGCSVGRIGEATRLSLQGREAYLRHTRLDMDYLCALTDQLVKDAELRKGLRYRPNTSLYRAGGRLRYAEGRQRDRNRSYHLVAVEETDYLLETLKKAEGGATLHELAEALLASLADDTITLADAEGYLHELVDSQLLVPELNPPVTGPEPIHELIPQLRALPGAETAAARLESTRDALAAIDAAPLGLPAERYKSIAQGLEELPAKVDLARLFQTDMVKPAPEASLGKAVMEELERVVQLCHKLSGRGGRTAVSRFAEAFQTRYETREMPLTEVLDEESGIGFDSSSAPGAEASPLLEGLAFPGQPGESSVAWTRRELFLIEKLMDPEVRRSQVLKLDPKDLEPFFNDSPQPLPDSFSVMGQLAAASPEALEQGDFKICLQGASGPSGANLLGRFCHGDPELSAAARAYLKEEEALRPDAVFAEIVHLPEGRIGNVILRPLLRGYEIPFLGRSGAPEELQIPVTDLMVSVKGSRVVLRSKKLDKEVLPRLTNAHNYSFRSLGMYRFLCMLQHQGVAGGLGWSWGQALETLPFLPRIEVGRAVLGRAQWRVEQKEVQAALDAKAGFEAFRAVQAWRAARELPRMVLLVDGDNKLPLDLDNALSVETFLEMVKNRPSFQLEELYPGPGELCAAGPEGVFVHELVVPFTRVREVRPVEAAAPAAALEPVARRFAPGSEWLYAKLYAGSATVDQILRELTAPLVQDALASGAAQGWFFIRYGDPDWHLRLRFRGDGARLAGEVLPKLQAACAPLLADGRMWKLVLDTYEREIERYGDGEAMVLGERLFHEDSAAVLEILQAYPGEAAADARWRLCLRGLDLLLQDLGLDLKAKLKVMTEVRAGFLAEFRGEGAFEHQLGTRFRRERPRLDAMLDPSKPQEAALVEGLQALDRRSQRLAPIAEELRRVAAAGGPSIEYLAPSYLHMHANRLLRASARAQELVLYDFMVRLYESRLAREQKGAKAKPVAAE